MLNVMNQGELEQYEADQRPEATEPTPPLINALAGHIDACWQANKRAKQPIETVLLQCLRQRNGEYDPDVLAQLKAQGDNDPIYMMVTDIKCRAAIAWIKDAMLPPGETPFRCDPTPVPNLPPSTHEVAKLKVVAGLQRHLAETGMAPDQLSPEDLYEVGQRVKSEMTAFLNEQAEEEAKRSTREIDDDLKEGGWYHALSEYIDDFCTYPAAFMTGPVLRYKRVLEWPLDGSHKPQVVQKVVKEYRRVSPFDIFPSANAKSLDDGNLIERVRYSPSDLQDMIGVDGYDEAAIRRVLDDHAQGGLEEWLSVDDTRDDLEDRHATLGDREATIDCLKFMGDVQGKLLMDWGMSADEVGDPDRVYPVVCFKIGNEIISAQINAHPLRRRGYYCASFVRKAGSLQGRSVPQILRDIQRLCNSAATALRRNMAIASGPQVWVNESRINPGQDVDRQWPWKVWRFTDSGVPGRNDIPMGYFTPPSVTQELLAVYKHFYDQAGEVTGIPAYIHSSEKIGGAGKTASGLSMLMNAAAKGLRNSVSNIDEGVVRESVFEHWLYLMLHEPDRVAGDIFVVPRASDYLMQVEQLQLATFDALQLTNNPIDMDIIGKEGRGEMLREYLRRLKIPVEKIVPDRASLITSSAEQKFVELVTNLAQALGTDPQRLIAIAQQGGAPNAVQGPDTGRGGQG